MILETPLTAESGADLRKSFYSPAEVAALVGVSSSTILNYIHAGNLPAVRLSERTFRIPRKAVIVLLGFEAQPPTVIDRPDDVVDL
jgi:excisionase family DNA binding protein